MREGEKDGQGTMVVVRINTLESKVGTFKFLSGTSGQAGQVVPVWHVSSFLGYSVPIARLPYEVTLQQRTTVGAVSPESDKEITYPFFSFSFPCERLISTSSVSLRMAFRSIRTRADD